MSLQFKEGVIKLVSVLATSIPVTRTWEKKVETAETTGKDVEKSKGKYPENLIWVPSIRYPITFQIKSVPISGLFNSSCEVNAIHLIFARELGLFIMPIDVRDKKIDGTTLDIFGMVVAAFWAIDKVNRVKFYEETFLVTNISLKVVLGILIPILSNADMDFLG